MSGLIRRIDLLDRDGEPRRIYRDRSIGDDAAVDTLIAAAWLALAPAAELVAGVEAVVVGKAGSIGGLRFPADYHRRVGPVIGLSPHGPGIDPGLIPRMRDASFTPKRQEIGR